MSCTSFFFALLAIILAARTSPATAQLTCSTIVPQNYMTLYINPGFTAPSLVSVTCPSGTYPMSRFYNVWSSVNTSGFSAVFRTGTHTVPWSSLYSCIDSTSLLFPYQQQGELNNTMSLSITCGINNAASCVIHYSVSMECSAPVFPPTDYSMCLMAVSTNSVCEQQMAYGRTLIYTTMTGAQNRYCCMSNPSVLPVFDPVSNTCNCGIAQTRLRFISPDNGNAVSQVTGYNWTVNVASSVVRKYTLGGGSGQYNFITQPNLATAVWSVTQVPYPNNNQWLVTIQGIVTEIIPDQPILEHSLIIQDAYYPSMFIQDNIVVMPVLQSPPTIFPLCGLVYCDTNAGCVANICQCYPGYNGTAVYSGVNGDIGCISVVVLSSTGDSMNSYSSTTSVFISPDVATGRDNVIISGSSTLSTNAIIGIAVGGFAFIILVILLIVSLCYYYRSVTDKTIVSPQQSLTSIVQLHSVPPHQLYHV